MKNFIQKLIIKITGYRFVKNGFYSHLYNKSITNSYEFIEISKRHQCFNSISIEMFIKSKSQILQDVFVLMQLNFAKRGYFVEFGAADGVNLSNTYLLEREFDWSGILAEPSRQFHDSLEGKRNCHIDKRCVYNQSNETVLFNDVIEGEFSTIDSYSDKDNHKHLRKKGRKYKVQTVSLNDLLDDYNAPKLIDYISIDTEGSEYEILRNFNFKKYSFKVITVEHNYSENRDKIKNLLGRYGYVRIHEDISYQDDWYINKMNLNP